MASRTEQKERLRRERLAREQAEERRERRRRRLWLLGASVLAAAVGVAIAIAISQSGGGRTPSATGPGRLGDVAQTTALFAGIPQHGVTLGDSRAPVTLTEFADLQCPFCRQYTLKVLPALVRRYVRRGRVKMVFRNLSIIGPDSEHAARMAVAAGLQNRLWQFSDLVYHNQGQENSGYVTDSYLRRIAQGAGVDVRRAFADRTSPLVDDQLRQAGALAQAAGVTGTPSFLLARTGQPAQPLVYRSFSLDEFIAPIDATLAGR
jgi:protein-disulfide isomerase